ncbi:MAG: response regulator [Nanoarchaeota archaeon]|nr:response regulator [Nanoarchaeota archaeon]
MNKEKSILLIDDNSEWILVFSELINSMNGTLKLYAAASGEKGKATYMKLHLENQEPSLVLIDIRLGDMDGRVLAKDLKAYNKDANLCFFTFYMEEVIGKNLGIPAISKQLPTQELLESLKKALIGEHVV